MLGAASARPVAASSPLEQGMGAKILIVDDSAIIRRKMADTLGSAGFAVLEAVDGLDGLEKVAAHPDIQLIFCDLNMPAMNGIELLEQLRARECEIAVVMMSSDSQFAFVERARALGAKGWLMKPFKTELMLVAAKKLSVPPGTPPAG